MFFLALAPFGAFSLLMMATTAGIATLSSALIAAAVVLIDALAGRGTKIFAVGTLMVFVALAVLCATVGEGWSTTTVRVALDLGVLAVVLFSLAIRVPFTIQYGREVVEPEIVRLPGFVTANYVLSWVWAAACVLMLIANLMVIYVPTLPLWIGLIAVFGIRNAAVSFTRWYPGYRQARAAATNTQVRA